MPALAWPVDYYPFWREESPWPFAHYVMPLALYAATRNVLLTMLFVYMWESLEQTLARIGYGKFAGEQWDDSWIGDILLGLLAAGTFGLVDGTYGWQTAVITAGPPLWLRVSLYLVLAIGSIGVRFQCTPGFRWQILIFTAFYTGLALLVYVPYWADSGVRNSTIVWLAATLLTAFISSPVLKAKEQVSATPNDMDLGLQGPSGRSAYVRVFSLALGFLILALSLHVVQTAALLP